MKDEAIVLTSPGAAAIAVVRLAGPGVLPFLQRHFSREVTPMRALHGELRDGEQLIDDPVIVLAADELKVDLNLHGGPWVVEASLRLAERAGFARIDCALPLPVTAVDAEDGIEQEILAYLPLATTELAVRTLLAQREAWQNLLREFDTLNTARASAILADQSLHFMLHPPTVAIVGIPNAGKSTLANQLFAQERSITADLPGTTRDWVGEIANIDGLAVRLIDTPGLRESDDAIEQQAITRSRAVIASSQLVIVLLDVTQPMETQSTLIDRYPGALVVANKIDRNPSWNALPCLQIAAGRGEGIDALRKAIRRNFGCDEDDINRPRCWTARQRELLRALMSG